MQDELKTVNLPDHRRTTIGQILRWCNESGYVTVQIELGVGSLKVRCSQLADPVEEGPDPIDRVGRTEEVG